MNKQEQRKSQTRQLLLNSAYELFTTVGFQHTTITDIAKRAGVGKGTFYNYFQDKEDARDALIVHKSSELIEEGLQALKLTTQEKNPEDKLLFIVDYILNRLAKDIALLRFISKNLSWGLFVYSNQYKRGKDLESIDLRQFIRRLLSEDGLEINKKMELKIFTIFELVNSTCYTVILEGQPVTFSEYKPFLYNCIRNIFSQDI